MEDSGLVERALAGGTCWDAPRLHRAISGQHLSFLRAGRVNLIGEHTDYNDGFVLPCAIDFHVAAAMTPAPDSDELTVCAVDLDSEAR